MRFNNAKSKKWVPFVYFFLCILSILAILYTFFFRDDFGEMKYWYSAPIIIILILLILYGTAKYFEFDSDGNALSFVNKGLFITDFINYREQRAEFPKEKLVKYKVCNYIIFKYLKIYVRSKSNQIKRVRFNISLLNGRK